MYSASVDNEAPFLTVFPTLHSSFNMNRLRLRSDCHAYTQNLSDAFNPSRLAPVEHTHAQGHTLMETDAIHWNSGQPFTAPREHGGTVPWP